MYTKLEDFRNSYQFEKESTEKMLDQLTDESLKQAVNNDHRNIARIAWHIITTYADMMSLTGLIIEGATEKDPIPKTAKEIKDAYTKATDSFLEQVNKNWTDDSLFTEDNMYGEQWKKGSTLLILIKHEIHHRGQLNVLMRQAGLVVPDIYGPAKEGWAKMNMEAPKEV